MDPLKRFPTGRVALAGLLSLTLVPGGARAQTLPELVRNRIEAGRVTGEFHVEGDRVLAVGAVPDFYLRREYRLAWVSPAGTVAPRADSLLVLLGEAGTHGLDGSDYHARTLAALRNRVRQSGASPDPADLAELEILLTDAFLVYGSHLLLGRIDPERVEAEWIANRRDADLVLVLEEALARRDLRSALAVLAPAQPEYQRLRMALAQLREAQAAGGWGRVDEGPTLREGEASPRIAQVRRRLLASTDTVERRLAAAPDSLADTFTADLAAAVRGFQHRHGLDQDGAVGARTLEALNVPVEVRIRQVTANLERWRWLPHDLGARHIRVNIAAFETEVWDEGRVAMRVRSIVGRQYRMTPSFTASMRYLVVAPYWHVPPTIAALDKLPEIKRDVGYLARQRFTLLDLRTNEVVDPATVDWPAMTGSEFNRRYRLRQDPGPLNALGNVKFMFPNAHHVYLHDTPQRELFQRTQRDFSSGCIRIENPMALAAFLLSGDPSWTPAALDAVVAEGKERTIFLPEPIPVHLLYMTAFVDPEGHVHFRSDLYGRDGMVLDALAGDPPAP